MSLPDRGSFPSIEDHLVVPEITRDEIIGGRRVVASPAEPPHATQQTNLNFVLRAHVVPGYTAASDLLTRYDEESDFASDTCVFKNGVDPATGTRYLEEIVFEILSEQNEGDVTEKAVRMHRRGVRRIFGIWAEGRRRVCEWSPETQAWHLLGADSQIEDPCLVRPLSVAALLDAAVADNAVVEALSAKGNPAIRKREAAAKAEGWEEGREEGRKEGRAEGMTESILKFLEARGIGVSPTQREEILRCADFDRLDRWLHRAALASSADEVMAEP